MKKHKRVNLFLFLIILISFFVSCELIHDQKLGRIVLIGVGLDYDGTDRNLENPPNDIREIAYAFSHLAKKSNTDFLYIPMIQQKNIGEIPSNNYPNIINIEKLLEELKAKGPISANVYNGEFKENYSLTSPYSSFGEEINDKVIDLNTNDIVVFYYSGHGDENDEGVLRVPIEKDTSGRTSIALSTITSWVGSLNCKSLIVLDSCGSGYLVPENDVTVNTSTTKFIDTLPSLRKKFYSYDEGESTNNNLFLMASTLDGRLSYNTSKVSSASHPNSNFSYYFLEALGYVNDSATDIESETMSQSIPSLKNGHITIDSIYGYINSKIKRQQPILIGGRKNLVLFSNL